MAFFLMRGEKKMEIQNGYITEREVTELTKRATQTLRNDRFLGQGIPYIKMGRSVRYNLADVISFMESRKVKTDEI
jgi:hypothetical protein